MSKNLQSIMEECIQLMGEACLKYPWENKKAYANWLAQTYYFVRHTTSFLALSSAYFGPERRDDHYKMIHHLNEELNHDKLAFEDIKGLGLTLNDLPEFSETSAFYQSQYYYIQHIGPVSLLGYALALEGLSAKVVPKIAEITGKIYGAKANRFLKLHATVDQDHFEEGQKNLADIPESEHEQIIKNLYQSTDLYLLMLERCKRDAVASKTKKAA